MWAANMKKKRKKMKAHRHKGLCVSFFANIPSHLVRADEDMVLARWSDPEAPGDGSVQLN